MKNKSFRDATLKATIFAFIIALFLYVVGNFLIFLRDVKDLMNINTWLKINLENPVLWLLALLIIIIPLAV